MSRTEKLLFTRLNRPMVYGFAVFNRVNLLAYVDLNPIRAGIVRQEVVRKYREFIYETGAADSSQWSVCSSQLEETKGNRGIVQRIVESERRRKYRVGRAERFLQRSRYFTDSGIIGSKEFVGEVFEKVKHLLGLQGRRRFKPVSGLDGVYSMKRLTAD